jgi:hypothetical protein
MLQGENDEATLEEPATSLFRSPMVISRSHTTCSMDAEQPSSKARRDVFKPLAVTVEVTQKCFTA